MRVQPQLGHQELTQVCSLYVLNESNFRTRIEVVKFTRHEKKDVPET